MVGETTSIEKNNITPTKQQKAMMFNKRRWGNLIIFISLERSDPHVAKIISARFERFTNKNRNFKIMT